MQIKNVISPTLQAASTDTPVAISLSANSHSHRVLITLTPPDKPINSSTNNDGKRAPLDICCVIDVSGSMGSEATLPGDPANAGPAESTGLSVLDVVKHALRTIIATMQEDDCIALVTFNNTAKLASDLTKMTESGKKTTLDTIEALFPSGGTNLWDGLKTGMDLLNGHSTKSADADITPSSRLSTLFILTDGMPNIEPPRGHIPMLKSYLDAHPATQPFSISTFGFGYTLNSALMLEIAQVGGGGYGFIPDSGMVGTVFVHAVANAYATYAPRAKLDVQLPKDTNVQVAGGLPVVETSWGIQIDAGDIQFGQSRDYILVFDQIPADIAASARYRPYTSTEDEKTDTAFLDNSTAPDFARIEYHAARLEFVEILFAAKKTNLEESTTALDRLQKSITTSMVLANHADALALAQDASGEGLLALQSANFNRWGVNYFPSLARAHQRQQCGNFKDPGLQVYGRNSLIFIEERDKLDAAFNELPPPTPSLHARIPASTKSGRSRFNRPGGARILPSMSVYNSSAGPCFTGRCLVLLPGGKYARVEQLKRGTEVQTFRGPRKIAAVVRTSVPSGEMLLCRVGEGLEITPWHPMLAKVKEQDKWVFPAEIVAPDVQACDAVYSILLLPNGGDDPDAHTISIGGTWCVTLGHGLTNSAGGDVRAHVFLGDYEKVLQDISRLDGFLDEEGVVRCAGTVRSRVDGKICGFVGEEEVSRDWLITESRNARVLVG